MAKESRLAKFTVERAGEDFAIHIETDDGEDLDLTVTYEQLDVIADQIDEVLDQEEDELEVDDD